MVSSALVESDINTTHSKINVDSPVITLMEGRPLECLLSSDFWAITMNTAWYARRLRPGYQGRARESIPERRGEEEERVVALGRERLIRWNPAA